MYCEKCGAKLNEGAKFCLMCGAPVSIVAQAKSAPEAQAPKQGLSRPKVKLDLDSLGQEVVKPQPAPISLTLDDMDAARAEAAKIKAEANAKANTIAESFSQQVATASKPTVKQAPRVAAEAVQPGGKQAAPAAPKAAPAAPKAAPVAPKPAVKQPPRVAPAPQINPERKMEFEAAPKIDVSADPGVQRTTKPAAGPEQPSMPKAPQKEIKLQAADAVPKAPKQEIKLTAEPEIDVSSMPEVQKTTKAEINLTAEPEIRIPELPDDTPKEAAAVKRPIAAASIKNAATATPQPEVKPQAVPEPVQATPQPEVKPQAVPGPVKATPQPQPADIPDILQSQPEPKAQPQPEQPAPQQNQQEGQPGWARIESGQQPATPGFQQAGASGFQQEGASGFQQAGQFAALEKELSTGRTLGILSIVFGIIIPIVGLILGIIGMNKMKKLVVPPQLEAQRLHGKKLNKIGLIIAIIVIVLGIAARIALEMYAMSGVTYIYE